jgi:hypothetical protein
MTKLIIVCFSLIMASYAFAQINPYEGVKPEDKAKIGELAGRVEKGDLTAFTDASKMDAKVVIPFLFFQYIHRAAEGDKSAKVEAARAAIRKVKGAVPYLAQVLVRRETEKQPYIDGFDGGTEWEALTAIGGMEAAAVASPYLFRPARKVVPASDCLTSDYPTTAAFCLMRMNLPDNPTPGDPGYQNPDVKKWQQWAIAHKLAGPGVNTPGAKQ